MLGRGGEGTVHAVNGAPKLVAKIYLKAPDAAKAEKLRLMTRGQSPGLLGVAAWPIDLLTDERGAVRGFLMGRISARQDAHRLYSPKSRRRTFPDADFRFVVRAATNLARAFAQIHAAGHVIGDVNHGNALIGKDGTAVLIDCDSIQVRERSRTFACDVGTPLFTPPELQGKAFRGLKRTESHDRFGLAVLLFHLLFQGRHPFAGVYADGEMPLERAIAESRFAYGAHAAIARHVGAARDAGAHNLRPAHRPVVRARVRAARWRGGASFRDRVDRAAAGSRERTCGAAPCVRVTFIRVAPVAAGAISRRSPARDCSTTGRRPSADADAVTAEQLWKAIEGVHPPAALELPNLRGRMERARRQVPVEQVRMTDLVEGLPPLLVGGSHGGRHS